MPIVWRRPDGTVAVTVIVESLLARLRQPNETTADAVARIAREVVQPRLPELAKAVPVLVPSAQMPGDRTDRNSWRFAGDRVVVDQDVQRARRAAATPTLEERVIALEARRP